VAPVAVALQLAVIHLVPPLSSSRWLGPALLAAHVVLAPFFMLNLRWWGIRLVAAGLLLNVAVMAANGGLMPVSPATIEEVGRHDIVDLRMHEHVPGTKNVLLEPSGMRLGELADTILIDVQGPLRKAISVGDIFVFSGASLTLMQLAAARVSRRQPSVLPPSSAGVTHSV
jgi:hypothetical protein